MVRSTALSHASSKFPSLLSVRLANYSDLRVAKQQNMVVACHGRLLEPNNDHGE